MVVQRFVQDFKIYFAAAGASEGRAASSVRPRRTYRLLPYLHCPTHPIVRVLQKLPLHPYTIIRSSLLAQQQIQSALEKIAF